MNNEHIVIVRTTGIEANISSYNCQEIGLAKALTVKGLRVSIIFGAHKNRQEKIYVGDKSIDVYHVKYIGIHHRYTWFLHLESLLEKLNPTAVQVHDMDVFMTWRVIRWAKHKNIRTVLIQGPYDKWRYPILREANEVYNRLFGRYIIKNATKIGLKTLDAGKYLDRYYKRNKNLVKVGLDFEKFQRIEESTNLVNKLALKGKKVLIYVGAMQKRRSPMFLLEVAKHLPDNYVLLLVGDGPLVFKMKKYIKLNDLAEKCLMLGKLPQIELAGLYRMADLFLLASDYEIFGMVIMEALYFGLPVLSTRTAGAETLLENSSDGAIMNDQNVEEWVIRIEQICSNKNLETSILCHKKIVENYSWDKISENYYPLYFD